MNRALIAAVTLLAGCNVIDGESETKLSTGLKIFVTPEVHVGDFAADPNLVGSNGIERADHFCNKSAGKPNASNYKALIVDGSIRDAVTRTNWVLEPNSKYFRNYGDVPIGTTTAAAIFDVHFGELNNSIGICGADCANLSNYFAWTGIGEVRNFTAGNKHCNGWGTGGVSGTGQWAHVLDKDNSAFATNVIAGCGDNSRAALYCVEQPAGK